MIYVVPNLQCSASDWVRLWDLQKPILNAKHYISHRIIFWSPLSDNDNLYVPSIKQ